jgi:hypothetical protein
MSDINKFSPITGRHIKEDGTTLNIADTLEGIASGGVQVSSTLLRQAQVGTDMELAFANSAAANTQKTVAYTKPEIPVDEYMIEVYNPSAITDLTVKVFAVEDLLGSGTRDVLITKFGVLKSASETGTTISARAAFVHGMFNGADCKLVISNDTALGAAEGFSAFIRVREVK